MTSSVGWYCDTRYGGIPRWSDRPPDDIGMRFIDTFKRNACFLCVEMPDGSKHIAGTAFFIHVPYETDPTKSHLFVVTARHVINDCRTRMMEDYLRETVFFLRLNTWPKTLPADYLRIDAEWVSPKNDNYWDVDAAVALIDDPPYPFHPMAIPHDLCATPDKVKSRYIGVGDEVHILGLFKKREGIRRNIPIVRTGTIAAMPEEEIPQSVINEQMEEDVRYYHAYLAEIRSIKGLSGSPVYVWIPPGRRIRPLDSDEDADPFLARDWPLTTSYEMYLLGLIRAHWNIESLEVVIDKTDGDDDDNFNTGIATVTPITDVLEIINGEEMMKKRKQKELEHAKSRATRPDVALPKKPAEITQRGFEEALKKASRRVSEPDEGKIQTSE